MLKKWLRRAIYDTKHVMSYTYSEDSEMGIDIALKNGADGLWFAMVLGRRDENPRMGAGHPGM
jgi:hypothetical protein